MNADEIAQLEPNLRTPPQRAVLRPTDGAIDAVAVTEALVDDARRHGAEVRLTETVLGLRVKDHGLPIIGPLPGRGGAYIAVMHSAVTLAPSAGRLVASEVLDGRNFSELQHLRPDRFARRA